MSLSAMVVCSALAGCGGGSPAAPTVTPSATTPPTPSPVISFADGSTDSLLTPFSLTPATPRIGDSVTVVLEGYLTREQKWSGSRIELWPLVGPGPVDRYVKDIVYGGENNLALRRWSGMRYGVTMVSVDAQWSDQVPLVKDSLRGVFADVANAGGPTFTWSDELSGNLIVRIDPADSCLQPHYISCARWWYDGSTVTRGELIFPSPQLARDDRNAMHSMGHLVGLNEWPMVNAVMNGDHPSPTFHDLERTALHMMYQHRSPGNLWPDREASFPASSGRGMAEARH